EGMVWVSDASNSASPTAFQSTKMTNSLSNIGDHIESLLHDGNDNAGGTDNSTNSNQDSSANKTTSVEPKYTIPTNATLTGATLMTPLIGRVPIDGQLPSPYHFKLVLSQSNLTANGYPLPGVKGAVMSGIASGDMLGSCARGDIHSITFVFSDGTISTTEASNDTDTLGYISTQTGNPCITGTFHSNAAVFLGAQMGLAGAEGYANALSSAQYNNTITDQGTSMSTLIGSANKAAMGQSMSAASQAAQTWWNQRVKNSFDYVYVPNVDSQTGLTMKVVVNITKAISVDYDTKARKVNYEDSLQNINRDID
ncbi:MAG: TIGR03752 family integrating conjugative element protein, partial [Gammaproteobacteria bacterium]|nr:TIGR03752 family integrating conjugative element protein [Gammaproteobacteria bacterium]